MTAYAEPFVVMLAAFLILVGLVVRGVRSRGPDPLRDAAACARSLEGSHAWGAWSLPYPVAGRKELWQERRCQCGNRDFREVA